MHHPFSPSLRQVVNFLHGSYPAGPVIHPTSGPDDASAESDAFHLSVKPFIEGGSSRP
jgi:hypothetical protein